MRSLSPSHSAAKYNLVLYNILLTLSYQFMCHLMKHNNVYFTVYYLLVVQCSDIRFVVVCLYLGVLTLKKETNSSIVRTRSGCRDVFNAYMCENAKYDAHDIPFCPTTATQVPKTIIPWDEAKSIYKRRSSTDGAFRTMTFLIMCWRQFIKVMS